MTNYNSGDYMKKYLKGSVIGAVTGFVNGLFGSGGGSVLVPCLEKFLKMEPQKAHAGAIAVILPLSVISVLLYARGVEVDLKTLLPVALGGIAGGMGGARLLGKISGKWLHIIFGIFMIAGSVRMIL